MGADLETDCFESFTIENSVSSGCRLILRIDLDQTEPYTFRSDPERFVPEKKVPVLVLGNLNILFLNNPVDLRCDRF